MFLLQETTVLKHLDLSKNLFGEAGGQLLGSAIGKVLVELL
jgi:Ran GTPase-activating protein (RanGAP) involved in mRNA processing and transport